MAKKKKKIVLISKKKREKIKEGLKKIAKKTTGTVVLAPILPFLPAIKKRLDKENISYKDNIDAVLKFYKHIIKKENFDLDFTYDEFNVEPVLITTAVTAILTFFKEILKKKQRGEKLTPEEELLYESSKEHLEKIDDYIKKSEKLQDEQEKEEKGMPLFPIILIGGAAIALFFFLKK